MEEMKEALERARNKMNVAKNKMGVAFGDYQYAIENHLESDSINRDYRDYQLAEADYYLAEKYYVGLLDMYVMACRHMVMIDKEREAHGL